jgi:hemerythrin-like domain-containing protein
MKPTEILMAEHRVIEPVLDCLERLADGAERSGRLDGRSAREAIEFLRTFADGCHHRKEEQHLFEWLAERGWPKDRGPIGMMLLDHDEGRGLIRAMDEAHRRAESGEAAAPVAFAEAARRYVELLRGHIHREDRVLFPMADRLLTAEDQETLLAAFEKTEHEDMGDGTHERMLALARDLTQRLGLGQVVLPEAAACGCAHH